MDQLNHMRLVVRNFCRFISAALLIGFVLSCACVGSMRSLGATDLGYYTGFAAFIFATGLLAWAMGDIIANQD